MHAIYRSKVLSRASFYIERVHTDTPTAVYYLQQYCLMGEFKKQADAQPLDPTSMI